MLSFVDSLLEAAKFLEQQERQQPPQLQLLASRNHRTTPPLHRQGNNVSYPTIGLFGGSNTGGISYITSNGAPASGNIATSTTTATAASSRNGNGFSSPPPAAGATVNLKPKLVLNGHHPAGTLQNGGPGRLLSPTLVSLPVSTNATLASVTTSAHPNLAATVAGGVGGGVTKPLLPVNSSRKRTYSNASNGGPGGLIAGGTNSNGVNGSSTTTTVLVGSGTAGYLKAQRKLYNSVIDTVTQSEIPYAHSGQWQLYRAVEIQMIDMIVAPCAPLCGTNIKANISSQRDGSIWGSVSGQWVHTTSWERAEFSQAFDL
uniref:Uncharacterized protein n=1 Tax=Anopheles culicifacies TaxID=139723 RepID=A0A182MS85_9DIPT